MHLAHSFYLIGCLLCFIAADTGYAEKLLAPFEEPVVIFRIDDIVFTGYPNNEKTQNDLIQEFVNRNIPLTLSVIPNWKDQEVPIDNPLVKRFRQQIEMGSIEIAQHGFRHHQSGYEQTEFRYTPYRIQIEWVQKGREILQKAFPSPVITFVPPWNNYDAETIRILTKLKFKCLSGDLGPVGKIDEELFHGGTLAYVPASCSLREALHAAELALSQQYQSSKSRSYIIVNFHPYDFGVSARHPITKGELARILDGLENMPVKFKTLSNVAEKYKDELGLSRQIHAARVETLGRALKLIPGLQGLLPVNYSFGRWIPFGVYLPGDIYFSIEKWVIIKISLLFLSIWIAFIEICGLILRRIPPALSVVIWTLLCSIFAGCFVYYFLLPPERISLALTGIVGSGPCLVYWVSRNLLGWYSVSRAKKQINSTMAVPEL
jgi:peptidoglycan/xylan/chitin deacetylase (PgdA/CDA1 family)